VTGRRVEARRVISALLSVVFAVAVPLLTAGPTAAASITSGARLSAAGSSLDHQEASVQRINSAAPADPLYPYVKYLSLAISGISPTVVTKDTGDLLTVTGVVRNTTKETVYDLRYVFARGDPLTSGAAVKAEIAAPERPTVIVGTNWQTLAPTSKPPAGGIDLPAGASAQFTASVSVTSRIGLLISRRGVYPVMIKVSGDVGQNGAVQYERVAEIHLLATVLVNPATPTVPSSANGALPASTGSGTDNGANPGSDQPSSSSSPEFDSLSASTTDIPTSGMPTFTTAAPTTGASPATESTPTAATGTVTSGPATSTSAAATTSPAPSALQVAGAPGAAGVPAIGAVQPLALNMLWPIIDSPHVGVSGIFLNDDLASEIAPGGRLQTLLTGLTQVDAGPGTTTVIIDPELLSEIQQMAAGYRVVSVIGTPQPALTPVVVTPSPTVVAIPSPITAAPTNVPTPISSSSPYPAPASSSRVLGHTIPRVAPKPGSDQTAVAPTRASQTPTTPAPALTRLAGQGQGEPTAPSPITIATPTTPASAPIPVPPNTVAGVGQSSAITFLQALKHAVVGRQVIVLPYSDPDAVAMIRAGLGEALAGLITKGRVVAAQVLQLTVASRPGEPGLITSVSVPEGGVLDDPTLTFLYTHGLTTTVLRPAGLQYSGTRTGAVALDETGSGGGIVRAAVADSDLLPMAADIVAKGKGAGLAVRLNAMAALLTGTSIGGSGAALVFFPDSRWTPNITGLQVLTGLLRTLSNGSVLVGTPVTTLAATASTPATLAYPAAARDAELQPDYLADAMRDANWLAGMSASLEKAKGLEAPVPTVVLSPLAAAMMVVASTGLRDNNQVGQSILRTSESTLSGLAAGVVIVSGSTFNLAASTSPLLITVRNDLPYVVRVRVRIDRGAAVGMTATDPGTLSIAAGRSQQFKIDAKTVKAGKFQIDEQLLSADGSRWSQPRTITVNSSAYGALTIVIIITAGGALFLMVLLRVVQRIRARNKPTPTLTRNPEPPEASCEVPTERPPAVESPSTPTHRDDEQ